MPRSAKRRARRLWSRSEVAVLRRRYPHEATSVIAAQLGRATQGVYTKAHILGLKKNSAFLTSSRSGRIQRGRTDPRMRATQFKPGLVPWNKGVRYIAGGRSAETRFKKGSISARWDQEIYCVGALRITTDGQLEIKIAPGPRKWMALARYVWWTETGKRPGRNQVVRTINGHQDDTRIENLELITRAENLRRNSVWTNYPPDVARLVQLKGAITRQVNRIVKEATA